MSKQKFTNCPNCGAPIQEKRDCCPYCGTTYAKGIRIPLSGEIQDIVLRYNKDHIEMRGYITDMKVEYSNLNLGSGRDLDGTMTRGKRITKRRITLTLTEL